MKLNFGGKELQECSRCVNQGHTVPFTASVIARKNDEAIHVYELTKPWLKTICYVLQSCDLLFFEEDFE